MKEENKEWEKEISQIAPWIPLKVSTLPGVEAPNGYYDGLEKSIAEKIAKISSTNRRRKYVRPILASAAAFLLLFSLVKFFWMDQRVDKKQTEYTIHSISTEEAALWLGEEAVISELDIQLFAEEMTLNTVEIKTKNK
ncbi:MAG: hypothetical protein NWS66_14080 [Saprospiraceae bacterium]|jgi:hypothetical protein|nr:hypothetical protein [Saprospiraceae bacterium]MDP4701071.1 hypothetical protein [Saprospiraceae bacterium]MDP4809510.1 hypothetical protein [Saprospiraceae bacterium]MDP4815964.1 hypothetical protein [Saprospiraceae bacterium]MDP4853072.1 hypothetical protein [Saprospiraceae bacterium]